MSHKKTKMKILNFKDFMKQNILKNDTINENESQEFIIIVYTPEIVKYIQIKDS